MTLLGGSTRTYKTYGKRKTQTINQKAHVLWLDTSPKSLRTSNHDGDESSEGSSSSDDEEVLRVKAAVKKSNIKNAGKLKSMDSQSHRDKSMKISEAARSKQSTSRVAIDKENNPSLYKPSKTSHISLRRAMVEPEVFVASSPKYRTKRPLLPSRSTTPLALGIQNVPTKARLNEGAGASKLAFERVALPPALASHNVRPRERFPQTSSSLRDPARNHETSQDSEEICTSFGSLMNKSRTLVLQDEDDAASSSGSSIEILPSPLKNRFPIASTSLSYPSFLSELLSITFNQIPYDFDSFVQTPPIPFSRSAGTKWVKIGEASYSEVFASEGEGGEQMVIKIIPVSKTEALKRDTSLVLEEKENLPFVSDWTSVQREVWISALVGEGDERVDGFVEYKGAFVVQGSYPPRLLSEWDRYHRHQQRLKLPSADDQIRPHVLPKDQVYAIICLAHAGTDLETFKLKTWKEAISVVWQAARAMARGEEKLEFEHRDLHWGNLLVKPYVPSSLANQLSTLSLGADPPSRKRSSSLEPSESGLEVTLIDFTLSRAKSSDGFVIFDAFEDEEVFEGQGDPQYEVYRSMRRIIKDDWEGFHPTTNLHWLHYLSLKLIYDKKLKRPATSTNAGSRGSLASLEDEKRWYETLLRLEMQLRSNVAEGVAPKKSRSKATSIKKREGSAGKSAKEFVETWGGVQLN